eukprot:CAMPEP_0172393280 /NCGR_PEP_ID=MMETSP1061-20121228/9189_1 /TAXON_ID=37318 /ORGANISM="Pseudo-nitzschia pungens, Strain cf. pungens" /LENGTH=359 /DNA_ID=CAMNT_0013124311 /DNA_START=62 /DNA_END=1138 /DNA_ORIENTATION=+
MGMTTFRNRGSTPEHWSNNSTNKAKNDEIMLPDFIVKRWGKGRYMMYLFTLVVAVAYTLWATSAALIEVPSSASLPLSILGENPSATSRTTTDVTPSLKTGHMTTSSLRSTSISYSIPLPLPKEKVSVVLMNFSRPRMIRESSMMRTLLEHPNIDEVLLLHANPKTAFEFVHSKVKNIDAIQHNNEMGLSLRFYFCQIARNNWVLHLDDDMEFTTEALNELIVEYGRNPKRIVGRFGRDFSPGNSFNGYNSKNSHKNTEVVLTKLMLMERDTCSTFFDYAHLVWDDVVLHNGDGPLWNGEDIFMSLVANHVYEESKDGTSHLNNYAMDWLDVWSADESLKDYGNGKLDISGGMEGYRFW